MVDLDQPLIAQALVDGNHAAFGELVRRHQSAVRNFLRHLTFGDSALSDDLAQETFVSAYQSLSRFQARASFRTWLLGIAHNHWRNSRRRKQAAGPLVEFARVESDNPSAVRTSDLRHDLTVALRDLSPEERLAVHLGYQQGLSHSEIAALLDWPLGTVKTHLARSKDKLRHLLAAWNPQT